MGSEEERIGCLGKVRDAGQIGGNKSEGWRPPCEPDRTQTIGQSQRCAGGCLAARGARHGARARAFHSSGSRARACMHARGLAPNLAPRPPMCPAWAPSGRLGEAHGVAAALWRALACRARGGTWCGGGAVMSTCMQSPSQPIPRAYRGNQEANHLGGLADELELLDDCNRRLELEQHPRRRDPKRLASGRLMREAISMHSEAISAEIRNDWRAVDCGIREKVSVQSSAVIGGHQGSSWGHQRSSPGTRAGRCSGGSRARRRQPCSACAPEYT